MKLRLIVLAFGLSGVMTQSVTAQVPTVISTSPGQNALGVTVTSEISVTFSEDMNAATIDGTTFVVYAKITGYASGAFVYDPPTRTATFTPGSWFVKGDLISITLTTGIESSLGVPLANSFSWIFTAHAEYGLGTLSSVQEYALSGVPSHLFSADLDFDRIPDIAIPDTSSDDLGVVLNDGGGNLAPIHSYGTLDEPSAVVAADFDRDAWLDLAVPNSTHGEGGQLEHDVSVLMNNGLGAFLAQTEHSADAVPYGITGGDIDGDGDVDLLTADRATSYVSVLLNDGNGIFLPSVPTRYYVGDYSGDTEPSTVVVADLNGDGHLDFAASAFNADQVGVRFNDGTGVFGPQHDPSVYYTVGDGPNCIAVGDIDQDGDNDLLTANEHSDNVTVLKNDGDGTFDGIVSINYPVETAPVWVVLADVDGDDDLDFATANRLSNDVTIYTNDGTGVFTKYGSEIAVGANPVTITAVDLNGNGNLELITANASGSMSILGNCDCPHAGDPNGDGTLGFTDLGAVIAPAFLGAPPTFDDECPRAWEDMNCDSVINIGDILLVVDWVFLSVPPEPCNPCDCLTNPEECVPVPPTPGQSIVVQSDTVLPSATNVAIGIFVENDVDVRAFVLPLEIREVTPGSYMANSYELGVTGRVAASGLADNVNIRYFDTPDLINSCSGPIAQSYSSGFAAAAPPSAPSDAVSAMLFSMMSPCLAPGTDGDTPSFVLTFDVTGVEGTFEIDTCCTAPSNHALFAACGAANTYNPSFTKGTITIGEPPDPSRLTTDPYLLACPKGDIFFDVTLKDNYNDPCIGYSAVWLDFSDCGSGEFIPQPDMYPDWPIVHASEPANDSGLIRFAIAAGGDCADCEVTVYTGFGATKTVPVRSTDVNGDLCVTPADHDDALGICRDLNADGVVDDLDFTRHIDHCCDHCFPGDPCEYLAQTLEFDNDCGVLEGDTVTLRWTLDNVYSPQGGYCTIDSVVFYQSPSSVIPDWERFAAITVGTLLPPGTSVSDSLDYEMPSYKDFCLQALAYTDCCDSFAVETACGSIGCQCPPGAVCYQFYTLRVDEAIDTIVRWSPHEILAYGWSYDIRDTTIESAPVTLVEICTSEFTPVGTSGILAIYFDNGIGGYQTIAYEVRQEQIHCDVCGPAYSPPDCVLDVFDVVCLIDYIFRGGPPPSPPELADINCDGDHNVLDVVTMVDCIFRGNCPCPDCDAGPGAW